MNYVLSAVHARRKEYTDMKNGPAEEVADVEARMLSVEQYHKLARRVIGKWAPANMKGAMLNSEDAIDFVAHHIMVGDWGYDQELSSIQTSRGYCGKRAIQVYIKTLIQQTAEGDGSLDMFIQDGDDKSPYHLIADPKAVQPSDRLESFENRKEILEYLQLVMGGLNKTQRACMVMFYAQEMTQADIARELKITREGVRRSIETAMRIIRETAGIKDK